MASSVIADGQVKTGLTLDTLVAVQKGTNVTITTPEKTANPTVAFSEMGKATVKNIMYSSQQPDVGTTGNIMVFGNDGKIRDSTVPPYSLSPATSTALGGVKVGDSLRITDGVLNSAPATPSVLGGVKVGNSLDINDGVLNVDINAIYPVNSIYMSVVDTSPASLFGGTWERIRDKFLLSAGDTYSAGSTGGEATHTLTENEMPSHHHDGTLETLYMGSVEGGWYWITVNQSGSYPLFKRISLDVGGNQAHNNMPPYLTVYVWKRTA